MIFIDLALCGGEFIATAEEQFIASPGWPNKYPVKKICTYNISSQGIGKIKVTFTEFELEAHDGCDYDHVKLIADQSLVPSETNDKVCGVHGKNQTYTANNTFQIRFNSDFSTTRQGFLASFKFGK